MSERREPSFEAGGKSRLAILQKGSSGDIGFWTGFQVATVKLASSPAPVEMRIRVTEIFRRMDGPSARAPQLR